MTLDAKPSIPLRLSPRADHRVPAHGDRKHLLPALRLFPPVARLADQLAQLRELLHPLKRRDRPGKPGAFRLPVLERLDASLQDRREGARCLFPEAFRVKPELARPGAEQLERVQPPAGG
jgi:hypothetical protein